MRGHADTVQVNFWPQVGRRDLIGGALVSNEGDGHPVTVVLLVAAGA